MASLLFSAALFISALLLFSVQPLIAKMLLPYLGGSPAVWNTCMVFFQVMLLAGYLYAHVLPRKIGNRKHAIFHLVLLLTAALLLPIGVPEKAIALLPSASSAPIWLLTTLLTTVGLPFFILSTNAPLLQSWFSHTSDRRARDPYFLYAASNFGSLLALLSYPLLLGRLRLKEAPEGYYSLIALDAFSSDAIPLHLLTREAVGLYLSKLADGGLLTFHVSNRHLDLSPVLGSAARSYGLTALIMRDGVVSAEGKDASIWVVLARRPEDLKPLTVDMRWQSLGAPDDFRIWTDDFSNIFSVLWR